MQKSVLNLHGRPLEGASLKLDVRFCDKMRLIEGPAAGGVVAIHVNFLAHDAHEFPVGKTAENAEEWEEDRKSDPDRGPMHLQRVLQQVSTSPTVNRDDGDHLVVAGNGSKICVKGEFEGNLEILIGTIGTKLRL